MSPEGTWKARAKRSAGVARRRRTSQDTEFVLSEYELGQHQLCLSCIVEETHRTVEGGQRAGDQVSKRHEARQNRTRTTTTHRSTANLLADPGWSEKKRVVECVSCTARCNHLKQATTRSNCVFATTPLDPLDVVLGRETTESPSGWRGMQ